MRLMQRLAGAPSAWESLAFYNTREEIDAVVAALDNVWNVFA